MTSSSLCIGSTVEVYELDKVAHALGNADDGQSAQMLRRTYTRMLEAGSQRFVSKPASTQALDEVAAQSPNFEGVLQDLAKYIELALYGSGTLNFMPVLHAGEFFLAVPRTLSQAPRRRVAGFYYAADPKALISGHMQGYVSCAVKHNLARV